MGSVRALLFAAALCEIDGSPAHGQAHDACDRPARQEPPIDVPLDDLSRSVAYKEKPVRTRGHVEIEVGPTGRLRYFLRDGLARVAVMPCASVGREFEEAARGRPRFEVTGITDSPGAASAAEGPAIVLRVWAFSDISDLERARRPVSGAALADVLNDAESQIGRTVRVLGQFGGRNLLKDLPVDSTPDATAWVLRDGRQALWIVGKRPEGSGFKLNPDYPPDASRWLEVEGKLERCASGLCLRARKVSLSAPPS